MKCFMKLFPVVLFLLIFSSKTFAQGYEIRMKVKGVKDTTVYLAFHYGDKQYLKDTAKVDSKGNFVFDGKEALPGGIYLAVMPDKRYFELIVNEQKFTLETDTANYVTNMVVKGSEENRIFYEYLNYLNPRGMRMDSLQKTLADAKSKEDTTKTYERINTIDKEIKDYRQTVIDKYPKTLVATIFKAMKTYEASKEDIEAHKSDSLYAYKYYKQHFFDGIDFSDDRILRTPVFHGKIKEFMQKVSVQTIDSLNKNADYLVEKARANKELFKYCVWFVTTSYETSQLMGADAVFVHMVNKYYKTNQAYWVDNATLKKITERANILEPLLIGKKIPNVALKDTLGNLHYLHNVKAKYTIVYFWDPNCGHCQKTTPKLYEVYEKYKKKGVEVYAVCIDRKDKDLKKYIREHKLHWINVYDPDLRVSFKDQYDVYATPVMYIINEKKEIIAKRLAYDQVDDLFKNLFEQEEKKKK